MEQEKPTFAKGDRVRLRKSIDGLWADSHPVGAIAIVECDDGSEWPASSHMRYRTRFEDGQSWIWTQEGIEEYFAKAVSIEQPKEATDGE